MLLAEVAEKLHDHHSELRVSLPSNHPLCEEALAATLDCVHGIPERILLPTTNPHRRAALRQRALENISLENNPPTALSRRIRTTDKLESAGFPEPLSPEQRAALKKKAENMPPPRAYVLEIRALRTEKTLVSIVGNSTITAVDWDVGMPQCHLQGVEMLWDTGAASTIITKDILSQDFQAYLSHPIHMPYKNGDGTRVQLSFTLEFTNTLVTMNMIAWVVDKAAIANFQSGILLGQRDCIDAIQYRSVPRKILEARGESVDEKFWRDLILESYVDFDGSLKEIV
ncbi:uncharacterized protein N7518_007456 [Penicillium psychrosexuale]|uniref:uncharacterized protein n=1 Tax=Penicillium psychrosexuale TaxID=1002107 RepID=UPI00254596EE|nr:uncharacterized protein N7518_007456 [Penicillium psychrosexuale]KAJ5790445.1 hypothetical protein N7518_007456 [Penicillium psychrosexuale]